MKFGTIYTELTKNPVLEGEDSIAPESTVEKNNESEARAQIRSTWKSSTVTQELVLKIKEEINDLIVKSISLSVNYPQTSNHQQIVQNLVRVDTLQKFLDNYIYAK